MQRYDGRCRGLTDAERAAFVAEGRVASIRFRTPDEGSTTVHDVIRGDPTFCGPSATSWAGRAGDVAGRAVADPRGADAGVAAGPEAAQAVSVTAVNSVTVSAVAILVSRTMFDHIQIRVDQ